MHGSLKSHKWDIFFQQERMQFSRLNLNINYSRLNMKYYLKGQSSVRGARNILWKFKNSCEKLQTREREKKRRLDVFTDV